MKFNMNDRATVRLTAYGNLVFDKHYKELGLEPKVYRKHNINSDGELRQELWMIMHIFGKSMVMGLTEICFENNSITIEPSSPSGRGR